MFHGLLNSRISTLWRSDAAILLTLVSKTGSSKIFSTSIHLTVTGIKLIHTVFWFTDKWNGLHSALFRSVMTAPLSA